MNLFKDFAIFNQFNQICIIKIIQVGFDEAEPTQIPTLVSGTNATLLEKDKKLSILQSVVPTGVSKKKIPKALKLSEVTKPLTQEERQRHLAGAIKRILLTNQTLTGLKVRLICSIAANSTFELRYCKYDSFYRL